MRLAAKAKQIPVIVRWDSLEDALRRVVEFQAELQRAFQREDLAPEAIIPRAMQETQNRILRDGAIALKLRAVQSAIGKTLSRNPLPKE